MAAAQAAEAAIVVVVAGRGARGAVRSFHIPTKPRKKSPPLFNLYLKGCFALNRPSCFLIAKAFETTFFRIKA